MKLQNFGKGWNEYSGIALHAAVNSAFGKFAVYMFRVQILFYQACRSKATV